MHRRAVKRGSDGFRAIYFHFDPLFFAALHAAGLCAGASRRESRSEFNRVLTDRKTDVYFAAPLDETSSGRERGLAGSQAIFDSVRRKFVRAPVRWSKSNLADVCHKLLVTKVVQATQATKKPWSTSAEKAKHLVLTEEFDPGSE